MQKCAPMMSVDYNGLSSEVAHLWIKTMTTVGKTMSLGMEEMLLNERRHSDVINPGAKSTNSPSAQGKNTKGSQQRRVSSFVFFHR